MKARFPYSTKVLARFAEGGQHYDLEIRAEKETDVVDWYKLLFRFASQNNECKENAEKESFDCDSDAEPHHASV